MSDGEIYKYRVGTRDFHRNNPDSCCCCFNCMSEFVFYFFVSSVFQNNILNDTCTILKLYMKIARLTRLSTIVRASEEVEELGNYIENRESSY